MADIFVEHSFVEPVSAEGYRSWVESGNYCPVSCKVKWLDIYLAMDGRRAFCRLSAPDAESVRLVLRRLGMPVERLWSGVTVTVPN